MVEDSFEIERDEIDEVLAVLAGLLRKTTGPVVRACLEEAHADIAHLAGRDTGPVPEQGKTSAA